ncbi:homeobox protein Hox-D13a [Tachysurus fulvidraco]|uniref:homeobox protein Hox-D13a n=1 Tax=Tachysurus fulvidraco TaxID=1234273 RepID=UPI001FEEEE65|nr:homeobox protein Hox-D13a [Tachysurus fulvidraco]
MERQELGGEKVNRSFYTSAFGAHSSRSSSYLLSDTPNSLSPEPLASHVSFPNAASCTNSQVTFGCHFANSFYSCKASPSAVFQQRVVNHHNVNGKVYGHLADKQDVVDFSRAALHRGEGPTRIRDIGVYQGYAGPYRVPGYIDVPVVPRARTNHIHDSPFVMEEYEPWNWSNSWSNQIYCSKEQTTSPCIWKSSITAEDPAPDTSRFLRRGRKKRVPYTKLQLKELEHEYTITKFITKERRRRIASSTNLSERQVTIWFQNRRVKDKKIISKISKDFESF